MSILNLPNTLQSWRNAPEHTSISRNDQLQAAAEQFEAMFLQQILKQMRKASDVLSEGSSMRSRELDTMRDFYDEVLAEKLAGQRNTGIADMLVEQLGGEPVAALPSQALQAPLTGSWAQSHAAFKPAGETVALNQQLASNTSTPPHQALSAAFAQPIRPDTKENRS